MVAKLAFCVAGIYSCYLTWAILQEKITTIEYVKGQQHSKFKYFIFLNLCQALGATLMSYFFLMIQGFGLGKPSLELLAHYLKVSVSNSLASPFGYEALKHINYPTMILGKSCKLVPVMLMNVLVSRKMFEWYKYLSVGLITVGVSGFMLFEPHKGNKVQVVEEVANSFWGLALLLINLLIDGATYAWQDEIFKRYKVKSQQMMFFMNLFTSAMLLIWLMNPYNPELTHAVQFTHRHPSIIIHLVLFSFCAALGQIFIFFTLEQFGSLSLTTVTVTRKLFTILISLFYFDHQVNPAQWVCVALVFFALIIESYAKRGKSVEPSKKKE